MDKLILRTFIPKIAFIALLLFTQTIFARDNKSDNLFKCHWPSVGTPDRTVYCEGDSITNHFYVGYNSQYLFSVQWLKDNIEISGDTNMTMVTHLPGYYSARIRFFQNDFMCGYYGDTVELTFNAGLIQVLPIIKPVLTQIDSNIHCNLSGAPYLWYYDNMEVSNSIWPDFYPGGEGYFKVRMTSNLNMCSDGFSDSILFKFPQPDYYFSSLNTFTNEIEATYSFDRKDKCEIRFWDISGREIYTSVLEPGSNVKLSINKDVFPPGMYFYSILLNQQIAKSGKIIVPR